MLILVNQKNERKRKFKDYQDLYSHIDRSQQMKRMRDPKKIPDEWVFTIHPYHRLAIYSEFFYRQKIMDQKNQEQDKGVASRKPPNYPVGCNFTNKTAAFRGRFLKKLTFFSVKMADFLDLGFRFLRGLRNYTAHGHKLRFGGDY